PARADARAPRARPPDAFDAHGVQRVALVPPCGRLRRGPPPDRRLLPHPLRPARALAGAARPFAPYDRPARINPRAGANVTQMRGRRTIVADGPQSCHAEVARSICVIRWSVPDPSRVRSG